jgi:hypothetical protein
MWDGGAMAQRTLPPWFDGLMKKAAIVWVGVEHREQPLAMWLTWVQDAAYILTGEGEQPDPGFQAGSYATMTVRSKETQQRVVTWLGAIGVLEPPDRDWDVATAQLVKARLNLRDAKHAVERWAAGAATIWRITPVGELVESPDDYRTDRTFAAPLPSPATTAGRLPWVLGARGGRGAPLTKPPDVPPSRVTPPA